MANPTKCGFLGRVNEFERILLRGDKRAMHSRRADSCLEMGDGDRVAAEIMRRADNNPLLLAAVKVRCGNAKGFEAWAACAEPGLFAVEN